MTEFNKYFEKIALVVRDNAANMVIGVKQRCVKDLLSTCKHIVGYFNHSPSAFKKTTNGKYLEKGIVVLKPFIDCTNILSARNATASIIIPNIKAICHSFEKGEENDIITNNVTTLFGSGWSKMFYRPGIKILILDKWIFLQEIKEKYSQKDEKENQTSNQMKKKSSTQEFEKVNPEIKFEMDKYKASRLIKNENKPLEWWKINQSSFPHMDFLVKKYLCAPPSSVESERFFNVGADFLVKNSTKAIYFVKIPQETRYLKLKLAIHKVISQFNTNNEAQLNGGQSNIVRGMISSSTSGRIFKIASTCSSMYLIESGLEFVSRPFRVARIFNTSEQVG
ncbi:unnamed protein product [Lepeophtheirus salmonis]|uniref:(salmon louse) hypothetical protein n=1 Tax=Lepeophtheirus salmonis TaxID=72036 RepID=A0A7R8CJG9_LEPSM|nr:unnamed protein product [Lepeophtheirus salmonis]CAF2805826.1 unnamed protein product [Lepeophtheirus salmonis]